MSACATDPDAIQSLAKELGPEHLALTCDETQPPEVGAFATRGTGAIRPTRLLLNNAAAINRNALPWEALPE